MYESFYGFHDKPFALTPDPRFLYLSDMHRTAYSLLEYSLLNQAGFVVISGEIGAGKTTLLSLLLKNLPSSIEIGSINNTHAAFGTLIQLVSDAFGLVDDEVSVDDAVLFRRFNRTFKARAAQGKKWVLVVDEAQNLSIEQLEQLRLLSNGNSAGSMALQVILVGQPELYSLLKSPRLEQFAQRISAEYHLRRFSIDDAIAYIDHRICCAGGDKKLFTQGAKQLAAYYGRGIPRMINNLCDMALVYGFGAQLPVIDRDILKKVILVRRDSGVMPLRRQDNVAGRVSSQA
jgi:type II secretory pathway predicted ATPase ExeA